MKDGRASNTLLTAEAIAGGLAGGPFPTKPEKKPKEIKDYQRIERHPVVKPNLDRDVNERARLTKRIDEKKRRAKEHFARGETSKFNKVTKSIAALQKRLDRM